MYHSFSIQDYLFGVANEAWVNEEKEVVLKILQPHPSVFSHNGRCDSPGNNAKYFDIFLFGT